MKYKSKSLILFGLLISQPAMSQVTFTDQNEGLSLLAKEVEALSLFIDDIKKSPESPGRYSVDFEAIKRDLITLQAGLNQAITQPVSVEKMTEASTQIITGDYLR